MFNHMSQEVDGKSQKEINSFISFIIWVLQGAAVATKLKRQRQGHRRTLAMPRGLTRMADTTAASAATSARSVNPANPLALLLGWPAVLRPEAGEGTGRRRGANHLGWEWWGRRRNMAHGWGHNHRDSA
jgi:hypothetical protein